MTGIWSIVQRVSPRQLNIACIIVAIVLAVSISHLLWFLYQGYVPDGLTIVAGGAALIVTAPLVHPFTFVIFSLFQSNEALVKTQNALRIKNNELALMHNFLSVLNNELEGRVAKRTAEMKKALETAEKANAAKSAFLANMSHELRTPLNGIIGYAEMIAAREALFGNTTPERIDDYAACILSSGRHLNAMVNDLLDLSKIEFDQYDSIVEETCLETLVRNVIDEFEPVAQERGQRIESKLPIDMPRMHTDPRAVRQILSNLLSNALKYSHDQGTVTIAVDMSTEEINFTVTDCGIGMARDAIDKATQPFSKFSDAHIAAGQSIGLGLSIVRKLCGLMGGTLKINSTEGNGTTARVRLPAQPAMKQSEPLAQAC